MHVKFTSAFARGLKCRIWRTCWVSHRSCLDKQGMYHFPVTEDMAIAALLHDAVEDEGGLPRLRDIEAKFGNKVATIVEGCTDSFVEYPDKKQEWEERKSSYIERLRSESPETLLQAIS